MLSLLFKFGLCVMVSPTRMLIPGRQPLGLWLLLEKMEEGGKGGKERKTIQIFPPTDLILPSELHSFALGFWSHESIWFCKHLSLRIKARSERLFFFFSNFGEKEHVRVPDTRNWAKQKQKTRGFLCSKDRPCTLPKFSGRQPQAVHGKPLWKPTCLLILLWESQRESKRNEFLHSLMGRKSLISVSRDRLSSLIELLSREFRKGKGTHDYYLMCHLFCLVLFWSTWFCFYKTL